MIFSLKILVPGIYNFLNRMKFWLNFHIFIQILIHFSVFSINISRVYDFAGIYFLEWSGNYDFYSLGVNYSMKSLEKPIRNVSRLLSRNLDEKEKFCIHHL